MPDENFENPQRSFMDHVDSRGGTLGFRAYVSVLLTAVAAFGGWLGLRTVSTFDKVADTVASNQIETARTFAEIRVALTGVDGSYRVLSARQDSADRIMLDRFAFQSGRIGKMEDEQGRIKERLWSIVPPKIVP